MGVATWLLGSHEYDCMSASAISSADGLRALARSVRDAQLGIGQHDDAALSELLVQCEALLLAAKSAKSSL